MKILFIIFALIFFCSNTFSGVTIGFNTPISKRAPLLLNSSPCEKMVLDTIDGLIQKKQKKCTIQIAMYSLDNLDIINKLNEALENGIKVQLLLDKDQNGKTLERLSSSSVYRASSETKIRTIQARKNLIEEKDVTTFIGTLFDPKKYKDSRRLHEKFSLYTCEDGEEEENSDAVIFGSYNWTKGASEINYDNCIKIQNEPHILERFKDRFNLIFSKEASILDHFRKSSPTSKSTTPTPKSVSPVPRKSGYSLGEERGDEEEDYEEDGPTASKKSITSHVKRIKSTPNS